MWRCRSALTSAQAAPSALPPLQMFLCGAQHLIGHWLPVRCPPPPCGTEQRADGRSMIYSGGASCLLKLALAETHKADKQTGEKRQGKVSLVNCLLAAFRTSKSTSSQRAAASMATSWRCLETED